MQIRNPITAIQNHLTNYKMFRSGIVPPMARFQDHIVREIGKISERYYPGADLGAMRQDWNPAILVDQNIYRLEYRRLYARAKRAYDTDPYAKSCVRVLQSQVVGTGITPKAKPVDKNGNGLDDLGKQLNRLFERFADECFRPDRDSFYDVQSKMIANCCTSGGLFLNEVPAKKGALLPFSFQQIDQGYIEFSHDNFAMPTAQRIFNGVEVNEFSEPQKYYFQDLLTWVFFDLPANGVIHIYDKLHTNQYVGIPWLAPVLTILWDLSQLQEDKLIASRIQTAIALWVEESSKYPNAAVKNSDGNISWSPGSIMKSKVKPEVIQSNDNIKESFGALIELYLRQVSSGMGVSYQEMTSDLAGANFASSRTVVMDRRRYYRKKQMFVERSFCQPIYKRFVKYCFIMGLLPGKTITDFKANEWGYCRAFWTPDRWDWVDPLKDINALIAEKDAGWLTDEAYFEKTGGNVEDVYKVLSEEKKEKDRLGISQLPQDPLGSANKLIKQNSIKEED